MNDPKRYWNVTALLVHVATNATVSTPSLVFVFAAFSPLCCLCAPSGRSVPPAPRPPPSFIGKSPLLHWTRGTSENGSTEAVAGRTRDVVVQSASPEAVLTFWRGARESRREEAFVGARQHPSGNHGGEFAYMSALYLHHGIGVLFCATERNLEEKMTR